MIRALLRRLFPARHRPVAPNFDALIARRSERVSNRHRATAAAYRRVHAVLREGAK